MNCGTLSTDRSNVSERRINRSDRQEVFDNEVVLPQSWWLGTQVMAAQHQQPASESRGGTAQQRQDSAPEARASFRVIGCCGAANIRTELSA